MAMHSMEAGDFGGVIVRPPPSPPSSPQRMGGGWGGRGEHVEEGFSGGVGGTSMLPVSR